MDTSSFNKSAPHKPFLAKNYVMDCIACKKPLREHEPALKIIGELPFETIKDVMKHQWQKDVSKIIYTHAQHYHDNSLLDPLLCQKDQLQYLEEDLKNHRNKYILHYLHAVVEAHRHKGIGVTDVTTDHEITIRSKLEKEALTYKIPDDLDPIFRGEKPYEWKGTVTWHQCKKNTAYMAEQLSRRGRLQEVVDRQLITVISIILRLNGNYITFVPKTPDTTWCWNVTEGQILGLHRLTKLDLF